MLSYVLETRNIYRPKTQPLVALKGQLHQNPLVTCDLYTKYI